MARGETVRAKDLRRRVLAALRAAGGQGYEGWLSVRSLWNVLRPDLDGLLLYEVREAAEYLAGKGYAQTRLRREAKYQAGETDARITPRGIDLLEETIAPDPGVEDDRE